MKYFRHFNVPDEWTKSRQKYDQNKRCSNFFLDVNVINRMWSDLCTNLITNLDSKLIQNEHTVKPMYNDHSRDPEIVAVAIKGLLFGGSIML